MPVDFKLYLITDRKQTKIPLIEAVTLALKGGVRAIQLREKDLKIRELLGLAQEIREITKRFSARLFINDRVDVAVAVDADGIHLGKESMPPAAVRKIVGKRLLIGVSTHTLEEAQAAQTGGADFITFGPVFFTPSKAEFGDPVGLEPLNMVKKAVSMPVFAIGGIKSGNTNQIIDSKADGVAVISAILAADNIEKAAQDMVRALVNYE